MEAPKGMEIKLAKVYKSSLVNEHKLKVYLHERQHSNSKKSGERPSSLR